MLQKSTVWAIVASCFVIAPTGDLCAENFAPISPEAMNVPIPSGVYEGVEVVKQRVASSPEMATFRYPIVITFDGTSVAKVQVRGLWMMNTDWSYSYVDLAFVPKQGAYALTFRERPDRVDYCYPNSTNVMPCVSHLREGGRLRKGFMYVLTKR